MAVVRLMYQNTTCLCEPLPISHTGVMDSMTKFEELHTRIPNKKILDGIIAEVGRDAFAIYVVILLYANWETGKSYVTQRQIGKLTGIKDRRTILKYVKRLADAGHIQYHKRKRQKDGEEYGRSRYVYNVTQ